MKNILDLDYGHCRLSLAVPDNSGIKSAEDIKEGARIATSFPNMTKRYFESVGKKVNIVTISGAAEIMPYIGVSDYVVDLVSTGSTLKMNRLREVAVIFESQAAIVTTEKALAEKQEAIMEVADAIRSVIDAEDRKYLMANVPVDKIEDVESFLPGIGGPTVLSIAGNTEVVAIHVVVADSELYDAINNLRKIGATGILTLSMDRLVK